MAQNIREEFYNKQQSVFEETGEFMSDEQIVDFFLSHHNTTLKEIEEDAGNVELNLEAGNKDHENFAKGVDYMKEKIKQLIHQKLIK
jgi:hypothetical protein